MQIHVKQRSHLGWEFDGINLAERDRAREREGEILKIILIIDRDRHKIALTSMKLLSTSETVIII